MTGKIIVLHTDTMHMQEIETQLKRHVLEEDEDVYTPVIERFMRVHGVNKTKKVPMFPGYLFLHTSKPKDLYERVSSSTGKYIFKYCRVLKTGNYLTCLSDAEAENIDVLCGRNHVISMSEGYMTGDKLKIVAGPLKDMEGKIVKIDRHKRCAFIEVDFLGGIRKLKVGLEIPKKMV